MIKLDFLFTINPETNKPNGFRILKAENDFGNKSGNTTINKKMVTPTYILKEGLLYMIGD